MEPKQAVNPNTERQQQSEDIDLTDESINRDSLGSGGFLKNAASSMVARHESGLDKALTRHNKALKRAFSSIKDRGQKTLGQFNDAASSLESAVALTASKVKTSFDKATDEIAAEAGFGVTVLRGLDDYKRAYSKVSKHLADIEATEATSTDKMHERLQQVATTLDQGLTETIALNTDVGTRRSAIRDDITALVDKSLSQVHILAEDVRQGKHNPQPENIETPLKPQRRVTFASTAKRKGITTESLLSSGTTSKEEKDTSSPPKLSVVEGAGANPKLEQTATAISKEAIDSLSLGNRAKLSADIDSLSVRQLKALFKGDAMGADKALRLVGYGKQSKAELVAAIKNNPARLAFVASRLKLNANEQEQKDNLKFAATTKADGSAQTTIK